MARRLARSEVPIEATWRLEDLFPSLSHWEAALSTVDSEIAKVTVFRGRLGEGPGVLLQCLEAAEATMRKMLPVGMYAMLLISGDGTDPANQSAAGKADAAQARLWAGLAFLEPEILALPDGTVERYLHAEPRLEPLDRKSVV